MRMVLFTVLLGFTFVVAKGQSLVTKPQESAKSIDTLRELRYVNKGKTEARKAVYQSLIFPGLGQIYNYKLIVEEVKAHGGEKKQIGNKIYTIGKLLGIYAGGTALVFSYIDNNNNYRRFLRELQYRQTHNNQPSPDNGLSIYTNTQTLTTAKNIFKRNREIVIISLAALYGGAALEAYISARLKFFNIDDNIYVKITPSTINTNNTMYGFQSVPALKLTLKL